MDSDLLPLAHQVGVALKLHKLRLATAESCTGGGLGYWLTEIPGSSEWFDRGFITYSNQAKIELLQVSAATLNCEGAVSEQTAREMAEGTLRVSHADVSLVTTGIAGPDGGSQQKPVGTVWFGLAWQNSQTQTELKIFLGNRKAIRQQAIAHALMLLLAELKNKSE